MVEALLCILYSLIFIFLIFKLRFFRLDGISRLSLSLIFVIKIICGIGVTLVYLYYYTDRATADVFKYFDDSEFIFKALFEKPLDYLRMITGIDGEASHLDKYYSLANYWYKPFDYNLFNDNRTIIRFNAVVRLFSFGHISVHTVFAAFISFTGLTAIYKTFSGFFKKKRNLLMLAVFFIPSILFWTSGILKESLLMLPVGFLLYTIYRMSHGEFSLFKLVIAIISAYILILLKFYILVAMIPGLITVLWAGLTNNKYVVMKFLCVHIIIITGSFYSGYLIGHDFTNIIVLKQKDFINMVNELNNVGSRIDLPELEPNFISITKNIPQALANSFFRPYLFEKGSPVVLFSALENFFTLLMTLLSIVFFNFKGLKKENISLLLFCLSFVIILFALSGITTPVLGALVRYKSPALPFLFILLLAVMNLNKLERIAAKLPILRNYLNKNIDHE